MTVCAAEDIRARVLRIVRADPTLSAAEIAKIIGTTRQWVHRILTEAEFRQVWQQDSSAKPDD